MIMHLILELIIWKFFPFRMHFTLFCMQLDQILFIFSATKWHSFLIKRCSIYVFRKYKSFLFKCNPFIIIVSLVCIGTQFPLKCKHLIHVSVFLSILSYWIKLLHFFSYFIYVFSPYFVIYSFLFSIGCWILLFSVILKLQNIHLLTK